MKNEKKSAKPFIVFPCRVYPHAFLQAPYTRVKKLIDGDSQGTTPDVPSKAPIPIAVEQDTTLGGLEGEPARVQIPAGAL